MAQTLFQGRQISQLLPPDADDHPPGGLERALPSLLVVDHALDVVVVLDHPVELHREADALPAQIDVEGAARGRQRELAKDPKVIALYLGTLAEDVDAEKGNNPQH